MDNPNASAYVGGTALRTPPPCIFLPAKCPLKARVSSGRRRLHAPCSLNTLSVASANRPDKALNEDDDAVMSGQGHEFGMAMPNLTKEEKDYLEAATSNGDYMRRMTDIVRKKDKERKAAMSKENAKGPEDYLESLARPAIPPTDAAPPRVNAGDAYMEDLARRSRAERGIEDPPALESHRSSTAPAGSVTETDNEEDIKVESLEERISRLQESLARVKDDIDPKSTIEDAIAVRDAIRRDVGLDPPSKPVPKQMSKPTPKPVPASLKPQAIDKQIDFLEDYLEKLRQEEAEDDTFKDESYAEPSGEVQIEKELQSNISQLAEMFTPQIEGLADTAGGMSAAEKIAAFQQIRERAMNATNQEPRFEDPYNTILPSTKISDDDGEAPSPSSEAEYDEIGSQLHNKDLLVEEVEVEVARYIENAKTLLHKHDARMQVLLARLKALE